MFRLNETLYRRRRKLGIPLNLQSELPKFKNICNLHCFMIGILAQFGFGSYTDVGLTKRDKVQVHLVHLLLIQGLDANPQTRQSLPARSLAEASIANDTTHLDEAQLDHLYTTDITPLSFDCIPRTVANLQDQLKVYMNNGWASARTTWTLLPGAKCRCDAKNAPFQGETMAWETLRVPELQREHLGLNMTKLWTMIRYKPGGSEDSPINYHLVNKHWYFFYWKSPCLYNYSSRKTITICHAYHATLYQRVLQNVPFRCPKRRLVPPWDVPMSWTWPNSLGACLDDKSTKQLASFGVPWAKHYMF